MSNTASSTYSSLSRAQLTYDYLHTNSTTHEFLFGALAELVDNARDASATRIDICTEPNELARGKYLLSFRDDGDGMDPGEVSHIIQFGRSAKRAVDSRLIGQYGNGLKSGSMRIGKDMILFTKKNGTMSCLFLSRSFHEKERIEEVVVPIPSWDASTKKPLTKSKRENEKHSIELNIILKFSPFKTEEELFAQFDKIGPKGTLVVIYNLKLLDNGESELDMTTDQYDIQMRDLGDEDDLSIMPERRSFRAYASIMYLDPRMKIYIKDSKVQTRRLGNCLYKPRSYHFTSKRFKTRSEQEAEKAEILAKNAEEKAKELEIQSREIQQKAEQSSKDRRAEVRKAHNMSLEARTEASMKKKIADAKKRSLKEPKTLTFTFGFNITKRRCDGMFIYNCSRLIKMYEKVGPQIEGGVTCAGVVGYVDVPYLVLEPTHNKQDFADAKEYRHLLRAMGDHLVQYWKDSSIQGLLSQEEVIVQGGFGVKGNIVSVHCWSDKVLENFGYISDHWKDDPSDDAKYLRKRSMQIPLCVQCVTCLKWRELPFSTKNVGRELPEDWCCAMNTDPTHNSCGKPEQKSSIPNGVLQRQVKSAEEKQRELSEDIKKKRKLEQLESQTVKPKPKALPAEVVRPSTRPVKTPQRTPTPPVRAPISRTQSAEKAPVKASTLRVPLSTSHPQSVEKAVKPTAKLTPITRSQSVPEPRSSTKESHRPSKRKIPVDEVVTVEAKKKKSITPMKEPRETKLAEPIDMESSASETEPSTTALTPSSTRVCIYDLGAKVMAKVSGRWYSGRIVAITPKRRVKVKFDEYPKDKYDKMFDDTDPEVRMLTEEDEMPTPSTCSDMDISLDDKSPTQRTTPLSSCITITSETTTKPETSEPVPSPTSSTPCTQSTDKEEKVTIPLEQQRLELETSQKNTEAMATVLRKCLCYFAPPTFKLDKSYIKALTVDGLQTFPLEDFFDEYEKGLCDLINKFQEEKETAEKESEQFKTKAQELEKRLEDMSKEKQEAQDKLGSLRKTGAKLIRSLNEDPDDSNITMDDESETVDAMLEAIANQATCEKMT